MPKVFEANAENGEGIIRDMTEEEFAALEIDAKRFADIEKTEAAAAKAAEASKNAILQKLGITAEEAALLIK